MKKMIKFPLVMVGKQLIDGETNFENVGKLLIDMDEYMKFKDEIVENCKSMWGEGCSKITNSLDIACNDPSSRDFESWTVVQLDDNDRSRIAAA